MGTKDEANHNGKKVESEYNIFRDSALRYLGYSNEIGESFRYQVSVIKKYLVQKREQNSISITFNH